MVPPKINLCSVCSTTIFLGVVLVAEISPFVCEKCKDVSHHISEQNHASEIYSSPTASAFSSVTASPSPSLAPDESEEIA